MMAFCFWRHRPVRHYGSISDTSRDPLVFCFSTPSSPLLPFYAGLADHMAIFSQLVLLCAWWLSRCDL